MSQYRFAFDYLYSKGLSPELLQKKIYSSTPEFLNEVVLKLLDYTNFDTVEVQNHFNLMANSRLSGGKYLDSTLQSRINNCEALIRDSLLFADVLWIKNPMDGYFHCHSGYFCDNDGKNDLIIAITILYKFKSLLENGLARICGTKEHFCHSCLMSSISYNDVPAKYRRIVNQIENKICSSFKDDVKFYAYSEKGKFYLQIESSRSDLFEVKENKIELTEYGFGPILEKASKRKSKKIFKKEVTDSTTLYCELMRPIIDDVLMYNWFANQSNYKLSYLTNRDIDSQVMSQISSPKTQKINSGLSEALAHTLPTLLKIPNQRIMELRLNEREAFENYRFNLNKLLQDLKKSNISTEHAREALYDTVVPCINAMNIAVRKNKEIAGRGLMANVAIGAGSMVLGLVDTFLPEATKGPLMALGISNHGASAIHHLRNYLSNDSSIRDQQFYFLWKLQK